MRQWRGREVESRGAGKVIVAVAVGGWWLQLLPGQWAGKGGGSAGGSIGGGSGLHNGEVSLPCFLAALKASLLVSASEAALNNGFLFSASLLPPGGCTQGRFWSRDSHSVPLLAHTRDLPLPLALVAHLPLTTCPCLASPPQVAALKASLEQEQRRHQPLKV